MCGIAGRLTMELGLHSSEVLRSKVMSEREKEQVALLQATILIFDRHWSAAIGLPTNFQDSDFDPIPPEMVCDYKKPPCSSALLTPSASQLM